MNMTRNVEIASGQLIERYELINILQTALAVKEYRFARKLAEHWLDEYPGDLRVDLFHAQALLQDGREDLGIPILKRVTNTDPEFLPAQRLLALAGQQQNYSTSKSNWANVHALGGSLPNSKQVLPWSQSLAKAKRLLKEKNLAAAESEIHAALAEAPDSPLPAILQLASVYRNYDWQTIKLLSQKYHDRWPDCLQFSLYLADSLMNLGEEERSVQILHHAASLDIAGQVPKSIWGSDYPYKAIWPQTFVCNIDFPIPASVIGQLGWNQLQAGQVNPFTQGKSLDLDSKDLSSSINAIKDEFSRIALRIQRPELARDVARYPIYLILSTRAGLVAQYGEDNFHLIDEALKKLVLATDKLHRWDAVLIYADDGNDTRKFNINPAAPKDPWSIKNLISDLDEALKHRGEMIGALLLVGGTKVVPFHRLPNPIDDVDIEVLSDNPYACADDNYFVPTWPVGRLPGSNSQNPKDLLKQIHQIIKNRSKVTAEENFLRVIWNRYFKYRNRRDSFGYSAQIWRRASNSVFRPIGKPDKIKISPPTVAKEFNKKPLKPSQLAYYNLHGLEDAPEWFGQRDPIETITGEDYPVALRPSDILNSGRAPEVVFSEACYGANIISKSVENAISLKFLDSGTLAMIGSTCTSYGSVTTPLIAADLLGKLFWNFLKTGYPVGLALQRAKLEMARQMHKRQGYLDGEDQKTLISFVLYGDPLALPKIQGHKQKSILRPEELDTKINVVCAKSNPKEDALKPVPPVMMNQVKSIVKEYLPGMNGARLNLSYEHTNCQGHNCPTKYLGSKSLPLSDPHRSVVTLRKSVSKGNIAHNHYARITLDEKGQVVKLSVSR